LPSYSAHSVPSHTPYLTRARGNEDPCIVHSSNWYYSMTWTRSDPDLVLTLECARESPVHVLLQLVFHSPRLSARCFPVAEVPQPQTTNSSVAEMRASPSSGQTYITGVGDELLFTALGMGIALSGMGLLWWVRREKPRVPSPGDMRHALFQAR
jgi:hypothetical protein